MKKPISTPTYALLLLTVVAVLFGCSRYRSAKTTAARPQQTEIDASDASDEYAVYAAVLTSLFLQERPDVLVIRNRTLFYANPDYLKSTTAEQRVQDMKRYFPEVDETTLRDFDAKQVYSSALTSNFNVPIKYVLINNDDFNQSSKDPVKMFRDFNQQYPGARGIIALSNVGFNESHDQAFVRVEFTFCPLCGHGDRVLLRKEYGKWAVVDTFQTWVS
jgi:hypothetical protein